MPVFESMSFISQSSESCVLLVCVCFIIHVCIWASWVMDDKGEF